MKATLALMAIAVVIPAHAGDYPQTYSVIRDAKGQRVDTIECDGITSQCAIRNPKGQRTGSVDQESVGGPPDPDKQEIVGHDHAAAAEE